MKVNLTKEIKNLDYAKELVEEMKNKNLDVPLDFPLKRITENLSWKWSNPRKTLIPKSDGKSYRDIYIFNSHDSFYQKLLNKIISKKLNNLINDKVFSYRKGKRIFSAVYNLKCELDGKTLFGIKLDISNYFLSVNSKSIHKAIENLIEDDEGKKLLHDLFNINHYEYKGEIEEQYLGIMPGCALSSFFANYMLKDLDYYLSENTIGYSRYSDDLVFFCKTEKEIDTHIEKVLKILKSLGLTINPKKIEKLDSSKLINFLGLRLDGETIDVSIKTFNNIKKLIKKVTNRYEKLVSLKNLSKEEGVEKCISKLNKLMYASIIKNRAEHKPNRMDFVFANINTDSTLKKLDKYLIDSLNFVYTGKHNFSTKRLKVDELEELGYHSSVQLFNLYKMDKQIYINYIEQLCTTHNKPKIHFNKQLKEVTYKKYYLFKSFTEMYYEVLRRGYFIIENKIVPAEYFYFDLENRRIYINDFVLYEFNDFTINHMEFKLDDTYYFVELKDLAFSSLNLEDDLNILTRNYLAQSYSYDIALSKHFIPYEKFNYNLFKKWDKETLITDYSIEYLRMLESAMTRQAIFYSYLFFQLENNKKWNELNYNHKFIKVVINYKYFYVIDRDKIM